MSNSALKVEVVRHANRGHGQTCLAGYRIACERGGSFVFRIASDGQYDPQYFFRFWRMRDAANVIYGLCRVREDGWRRRVASLILKFLLLVVASIWRKDANVPYRLMRTEKLSAALDLIPGDLYLENVALAVVLKHRSQ